MVALPGNKKLIKKGRRHEALAWGYLLYMLKQTNILIKNPLDPSLLSALALCGIIWGSLIYHVGPTSTDRGEGSRGISNHFFCIYAACNPPTHLGSSSV